MRQIGIFVFLGWLLVQPLRAELYLMPLESEAAMEHLKKTIDGAERTIEIAMFSFTNQTIAKWLRSAAARGVKIDIIYDYESNVEDKNSQAGHLAKYRNIQSWLLKGKRPAGKKWEGKMHMKVAVVDGKQVVLGSANWSFSAFHANYETLLLLEDQAMAKKLTEAFAQMKKESKPY